MDNIHGDADYALSRRRAGFMAVMGWTNVGKSTLLNKLLGQKLVIASPRPQTTRYATPVVFTEDRGQIIFVDTPGIHDAKTPLNEMMILEAEATLSNCDAALQLISPDVKGNDRQLRAMLGKFKGPRLLAVNKIDLLDENGILTFLAGLPDPDFYTDIVPVSAKTGRNLDKLLQICLRLVPEGDNLFPPDQISDKNERFFMAEIIREKVIAHTRNELPYTTAVVIEDAKYRSEKKVWFIQATVYAAKESQKGIIIGAGGSLMRDIGRAARRELEFFLQDRVYLELWVKVRRNWMRDPHFLREIGYTR